MKNYYISMDLAEGMPCYDFVIKAERLLEIMTIN